MKKRIITSLIVISIILLLLMVLAAGMPTFPGDGGDMGHMQRYEERYSNGNSYYD